MKSILFGLLQVINPEPADDIAWLNAKKSGLFLDPEEVLFTGEWVKLQNGGTASHIDWQELDFFYYPFVGVNIRLPEDSSSRYFTLIVREKKEEDPLLSEFIHKLRSYAENRRALLTPIQ